MATDYQRLEQRANAMRDALLAFVAAAKDVQDHWSDPGSYTHNRLLTPMLVHEDTIKAAER